MQLGGENVIGTGVLKRGAGCFATICRKYLGSIQKEGGDAYSKDRGRGRQWLRLTKEGSKNTSISDLLSYYQTE